MPTQRVNIFRAVWNELGLVPSPPGMSPRVVLCCKAIAFPILMVAGSWDYFSRSVRLWWWRHLLTNDEVADYFCQRGEWDVAAFYRAKANRNR